jgi:hypothetical protein
MANLHLILMKDGKHHFSMGRCSGCGDLIKLHNPFLKHEAITKHLEAKFREHAQGKNIAASMSRSESTEHPIS